VKVQVLFFGVLKDFFEAERDTVELAEGATVGDLVALLRDGGDAEPGIWGSLAVAVNQDYAGAGQVLQDGDEVGLLPPVSGGTRGGCRNVD
jgi:molybdopterin converting factor subunit 1